MSFERYFPVWDQLTPRQRQLLLGSLAARQVKKGEHIHSGSAGCTGLLLVESGQLRAYILSEEGREITLYRLFDRDMCLLSASCILRSIQFDVAVSAEKDTLLWVIPAEAYQQVMWKSLDKRLASFLLEEAAIEGTDVLKTTHESIANHLGTHREVVTRMLRYFQQEGMVGLSRGQVALTGRALLERLAG